MAGGKETPRQKMIGMMYLVLTALLALNVSKAVLDAFVAIEENTQKSNIVQKERGDLAYGKVKSELTAQKALVSKGNKDAKAKIDKLNTVIDQMDKVDKLTAGVVKQIDELKVNILNTAGEDLSKVEHDKEDVLLWSKGTDGSLPQRMHLMAVQAKDNYDVPMQIIFGTTEGGDKKNIKGEGIKLWNSLNKFRSDIVKAVGTYSFSKDKDFTIDMKSFNDFEKNADLREEVEKMLKAQEKTYNYKEDKRTLMELYMNLTKPERVEQHGEKGVHWVGATFDHSPLVAAIASLSSLQNDVLSARALAMKHLEGKVSTGDFSFNKIEPLAYGPAFANTGDSVSVQVMMAAYDSDNNPEVTVDSGLVEDAFEIERANGQGVISFKAASSDMELKGTVTIKDKSGTPKTEEWRLPIKIVKPSGAISLPDLNVLYRGYDNKVRAVASGYDQSSLGGGGSIRKTGNEEYIVRPGGGTKLTLRVTGKNSITNKSETVVTQEFRVSKLPDPVLFWGSAKSGGKAAKSSRLLRAMYTPEIPLKAEFKIIKWSCIAPGLRGAPPTGAGGNLGPAGQLINAIKAGTGVSVNATVRGPDGIARQIGGSWKI